MASQTRTRALLIKQAALNLRVLFQTSVELPELNQDFGRINMVLPKKNKRGMMLGHYDK